MKTPIIPFFKFSQVSLLATAADFGLSYFLVNIIQQNEVISTIIGNVFGAIVAFIFSKYWVFSKANATGNSFYQIVKFAITSLGNWALNAAGVWVFIKFTEFNYLTIRVIVGSIVFIFYSYNASRWFVFYKKNYEQISK